jgi:hypothetical protein
MKVVGVRVPPPAPSMFFPTEIFRTFLTSAYLLPSILRSNSFELTYQSPNLFVHEFIRYRDDELPVPIFVAALACSLHPGS